jgi:thioredoxin 1
MVKETNQNNFDNDIKDGYSVVDYWASWCGPCRMVAPVIEELSTEINNVKFFKVDVDENMELSNKYGITSIPAIHLYKDGKLIDKIVGALPKVNFKRWLNENVQTA